MSNQVLIIEDSRTQAMRLQLELMRYGLSVNICSDGATGVMKARADQPSAIILDINLPTMNGYAVCQMLKSDPKTAAIPVIMLTQRDTPTDTLAGLEIGAQDYIPKDAFAEQNVLASLRQLGVLGG